MKIPDTAIDAFVDDWAHRLAQGPPLALAMTKNLLDNSMSLTMAQALEAEARCQTINFYSEDTAEALRAFTEIRDHLVDELRTFSPLAQRIAKKLLNDTEDSMLTIAIELEGNSYSRLRQSEDFKEGVEAFNSKRSPKFVGR